jgi:hypothetical protein
LRAQERNTLKAALRRMNDAEREISQKTLALGISEFIITNKQREKFFKEYEEMNEERERLKLSSTLISWEEVSQKWLEYMIE